MMDVQYKEALMREMETLEMLLECSDDEEQQAKIRTMLIEFAKYLNSQE